MKSMASLSFQREFLRYAMGETPKRD
jgi:hypothetical protein